MFRPAAHRAAVAALAASLFTLPPTAATADCDPTSILANVRAKITFLHATFDGTAALTAPLDVANDDVTRTDDLLSQGARIRKTKGHIRAIIRKLRAFRRRVLALERRHEADPVTAGAAVAQTDATVTVLQELLRSVPACPTTTTVTVTTSTTSTSESTTTSMPTTTVTSTTTTATSSTSTTNTTTHITRPSFTFVTTTSTSTTKTTTHTIHPSFTFVTIPTTTSLPRLDYQAAAKYGEANLSNGFSPDPYAVGMTAGGAVDVSYLGGSCAGFTTSAPDLRVNFGGGGASLLRFYFVRANGDPMMVVNDPYGNFYCVDDSFGTVNPTIDFNNPAGGSYDVWIASYSASATISGTLFLTENSGNHP